MAVKPTNSLSLISVAAIIDCTLKLTVNNTEGKNKTKANKHLINWQFQNFFWLGGQNNNLEVFLPKLHKTKLTMLLCLSLYIYNDCNLKMS